VIVDLSTLHEIERLPGLYLDPQLETFAEIETLLGFIFPGDDIALAIPISGSGSSALDLALFGTPRGDEPALQAGAAPGQPRAWFLYSATGPAVVTFATSDAAYNTAIEVYSGPDLEHLSLVDWNNNTGLGLNASIDIVVGGDQVSYVRVEQFVATTPVGITFSWTSVARIPTMQLSMRGGTDVPRCPASLRIDVLNGDANADVAFHIDSDMTVVGTGLLNAVGVGNGLPILLPALSAGPHTLHVVETSGGSQTGTIDFTVDLDPATLPPSTSPDVIPSIAPVQFWQLIDPAPGGEAYVFAQNPASMKTAVSPRVFTSDATSAPTQQGQALTWEGARKATQWSFSGMTQGTEDIEAFARFLQLQHRVLVVDQDGNGYVVTVESLDAKPVRDIVHPKAQTYTVGLLVYDLFTAEG
jgi:hypothetical protein